MHENARRRATFLVNLMFHRLNKFDGPIFGGHIGIYTGFYGISGYLNLWDIFRFIFRQLRMTFSHKIMVAEKNNFSSNA